jgi:hypothetical protein
MARAAHEWRTAARWIVASGVAVALLQAATWYVGDDGDTGSLQTWQTKLLWVTGINLIIAAGCTLFPKREPEKETARSR